MDNNSQKDNTLKDSQIDIKPDTGEKLYEEGLELWFGFGVQQQTNKQKALENFQKSANEFSNINSQFFLAKIYENDSGLIQKDLEISKNYYQLAANQGHTESMYVLGLIYEDGKGVLVDQKIASNLFQQAAQLGHRLSKKKCIIKNVNYSQSEHNSSNQTDSTKMTTNFEIDKIRFKKLKKKQKVKDQEPPCQPCCQIF